jgi:hypothetical protein
VILDCAAANSQPTEIRASNAEQSLKQPGERMRSKIIMTIMVAAILVSTVLHIEDAIAIA